MSHPPLNAIQELRYERGLSQTDVARGAGVSIKTVRHLEQGHVRRPTAPIARALADFYAIPVGDLLRLAATPAGGPTRPRPSIASAPEVVEQREAA